MNQTFLEIEQDIISRIENSAGILYEGVVYQLTGNLASNLHIMFPTIDPTSVIPEGAEKYLFDCFLVEAKPIDPDLDPETITTKWFPLKKVFFIQKARLKNV